MTVLNLGVVAELVELAKSEGVVVWAPDQVLEEEEYKRLFPDLRIIMADKGFLNLNVDLASRGVAPCLIITKSESEDESILRTSLQARFVTYSTSLETQLRKQLGWPPSFEPWLAKHGAIFDRPSIAKQISGLRVAGLDDSSLSEKVVYSVIGADSRITFPVSTRLLSSGDNQIDDILIALSGANLFEKLWQLVSKELGYAAQSPSIIDFRYWLANSLAALVAAPPDQLETTSRAQANLAFFFDDFKVREEGAYIRFCEEHADLMAAKLDFSKLSLDHLVSIQHLPKVDRQILDSLLSGAASDWHSISSPYVNQVIQRRSRSPWLRPLRALFESLKYGLEVLEQVERLDLFALDIRSGIENYTQEWFKVDFSYRKHVLAGKKRRDLSSDFASFSELVEQTYVNGFQNKLGENWSSVVAKLDAWPSMGNLLGLASFYKSKVLVPMSNEKNRIAVVISDALRYEIGAELNELLLSDGYSSDIEYLIAPLPSYTQLGMAALLPNDSIALQPEDKTVLVDDRPSAGLANRRKILEKVAGSAIDYESLVTESKLKDHLSSRRLWYVYHNKIDKVGDNAASEGGVFEAVEEALTELRDVIRRLSSAGFKKIFVTADHGFLYQESDIPAHGFLSTVPEGLATEFMNRRFIIGRGLQELPGLKTFTSSQLGYTCDYQVQIPASALRLRRQGSGLRFVHGGASLQEVVVPLLSVGKRSSDLSQVEVSLAPGITRKITTGVLSLRLAQDSAVTNEVLPRRLRVFVAQGDDILSSSDELVFDSTDPELRNRIFTANLVMANRANSLDSRIVQVKLESNIVNTEQWKPYAQFDFEIVNLAERDF